MVAEDVRIRNSNRKKNTLLTAVVAKQNGEIIELDDYAAAGMAGTIRNPLTLDQTINMPHGSELMLLPDRSPVLFNKKTGNLETLKENPHVPGEAIFPVAVFNSPGYVITYASAFCEDESARYLPLFSYGAVGWHRGRFKSAAILIDRERRQDLRLMKTEDIIAGIQKMQKKMPDNRLRKHLEKCALEYGCPAAKNFFLGRYEAPLPTAVHCNARCLGCLSSQQSTKIPISQERIAFRPSPAEITAVALEHIRRVKSSVVSFGQGCEGEPLLAAEVVEPAIKTIRNVTARGTINMNTNGSRPAILKKLFDAGLDSIRVSLNSVRKKCYDVYFQPKGYNFSDVIESIDIAIERGKFVAINYLNSPGFTDTSQEADALIAFLRQHRINMIQWRNLNFDPLKYWNIMGSTAGHGKPLGMQTVLRRIRELFPDIKFGYFNPPKEKFYEMDRSQGHFRFPRQATGRGSDI